MGLSPIAKERALAHVFARGDLQLGLASRINERGLLVELSDPGYKRQPIRFEIDEASSEARSKARVVFEPFQTDTNEPIAFFFVLGSRGELLADGPLAPRYVDVETGDVYSGAAAKARAKELLGVEFEQRFRQNVVRVRAGEEAVFPPGAIAIGIGEE